MGMNRGQAPIPSEGPYTPDPLLLEVLSSLNQIGAAINQIGSLDASSGKERLTLIVESAGKVIPGSSTVIYFYDESEQRLDPTSRVSAGGLGYCLSGDEPRPDGMGIRTISQRRRVLSYEEQDLVIHPVKISAGARTAACYPLVVAGQIVGALYVYLHEERPFSQLELLMLDNFVNQAAMAIYQIRHVDDVQRDLSRKEDELVRLSRAGLLISSRLRLEETLEVILQMALEVLDAHYGILRLMDQKTRSLVTKAIAGESLARPLVETLPVDEHSIMGWVALHRQAACVGDLRIEPWSHIYYRLDAHLEMRSELAVPLISASGRLEGVLNLESPRVGAFTEEDKHLLQAFATQAVIAIQEARLLDALQEIARLLLLQPCQAVLNRLVYLACDLLDADASAIWTMEGDWLELRAASYGDQRENRIPLKGSLTGEAVLSRGPVTTVDVRIDPRFHRPDLARLNGWTRALIVPLMASNEQEPGGAFSVYSKGDHPGRFAESEWDKKVLTVLAHYAVLAVSNETRQEALHSAQEQQAVAETFATVGDIAANLLHNLNNKVGTIPVRIQGILDKSQPALATDAYLENALMEIERSAIEAMEIVRENLSHLHTINLMLVDIESSVRKAIQSTALPSDIKIQISGLDSLPPVAAGEQILTLVFSNLLENAANAMAGKGKITFDGTVNRSGVEVVVSDDGPGIPPQIHDNIFEFNYSGTGKSRAGKLGFGLWWVKTVMRRLGGSVQVESDGKHGTAFRLRLPLAGGK